MMMKILCRREMGGERFHPKGRMGEAIGEVGDPVAQAGVAQAGPNDELAAGGESGAGGLQERGLIVGFEVLKNVEQADIAAMLGHARPQIVGGE